MLTRCSHAAPTSRQANEATYLETFPTAGQSQLGLDGRGSWRCKGATSAIEERIKRFLGG